MALPAEDPDHETRCGLLLRRLYGTQAAADGWQHEYAGTLVEQMGFQQGTASPCVFVHYERELVCSVHGDEFTTAGPASSLDWFKDTLEGFYELKRGGRLGPGPKDTKEAIVLNRVLRYTQDGFEMEADPCQVEKLLEATSLDGPGVKSVATPGLKQLVEQIAADAPLAQGGWTGFRALAARANYLASDRPDVQFSAKEICRWMAAPSEQSLLALKRLCRFWAGRPRLVYLYPFQCADHIDTYRDTDGRGAPRPEKKARVVDD